MNIKVCSTLFAGLILIIPVTLADSINDTYSSGDTLTATTMNNIKSAVNDNDSRITSNRDDITRNNAGITTNASEIADNFNLINQNVGDISDLQSGRAPVARNVIDIDCDANPDALIEPPYSDHFYPNTTFNITGDCNGPIIVSSDHVRLVGAEPNRAASIVLPNPVTPPASVSDGAIFVDGAHDFRVENLTVDVSLWGSQAIAAGTDAAGVYARNAFVRLIDVDVVGGLYGINPFRNAIIRLQGTVNITEFVNEGITSGDQSLVTTRGQVNVSSTRSDGNYMNGVGAYRSGVVDFRAGIVVTVPDQLDNTGSPSAIESGDYSHVRIRSAGSINITGGNALSLYRSGTIVMLAGTLNGEVYVGRKSLLQLSNIVHPTGHIHLDDTASLSAFNVTQLQGFTASSNSVVSIDGGTVVDGDIELNGGSRLNFNNSEQDPSFPLDLKQKSSAAIYNSDVGELTLDMGSTLDMSNSTFAGGEINRVSVASIYDSSTSADLSAFQSFLDYAASGPGNYLDGNQLWDCSAISLFADSNVSASGTVTIGCPP